MLLGRIGVAATVALCVAAAPVAAPAQPGKPNAKALGFEKKGKKAYAKKRWDDAAAAFELAYGAYPLPRFLFNAGRAYEQKGDLIRAIGYVQRYVREEKDEAERSDGQQVLEILKAKLNRSHAQVRVLSTPEGAQVLIQGEGRKDTGTTPWTTWLPVGAFSVLVSKSGHQAWRSDVIAQAGTPLEVQATLVPSGAAVKRGPATLRLRGGDAERGAKVMIDGEARGAVPLGIELPAGRHLLEVKQDGYEEWQRWVELGAAEARTIELALSKVAEEPAPGAGTAGLGTVGMGGIGGVAGYGTGGRGSSPGGGGTGGAGAGGVPGLGSGTSELGMDPNAGIGGAPPVAGPEEIPLPGALPGEPTPGGDGGWGEEGDKPGEESPGLAPPRLSVSCNVAGAEVLLDGTVVGTAPLQDVEIPATPATLIVRREGHADFLRAIVPRAGERLTLEAVLEPKAGEYAAGRTYFKLQAGVTGVRNVELDGLIVRDSGEESLVASQTEDLEGTRLGGALQFGSMSGSYFGMGAILGFWFAEADAGFAVSRTAEFSPFLEVRVPIRVGAREMLDVYVNAGGGLSIRFLHDDVLDELEAVGTETDAFGIGYNVVTALGTQVKLTQGLGVFLELGWQMRWLTHPLRGYRFERVRDGSRNVGWNELTVGLGLAHLH